MEIYAIDLPAGVKRFRPQFVTHTRRHNLETKDEKKSASRAAARARRTHRETIRFQDVNPLQLQKFVHLATDAGALVMLGRTSDGGSLVLYVKNGPELDRDYVRTPVEFNEAALGLLDILGFELETLDEITN